MKSIQTLFVLGWPQFSNNLSNSGLILPFFFLRGMIKNGERDEAVQTLMFSATWPTSIRKLAAEFLRSDEKLVRLTVGGKVSDGFSTLSIVVLSCFACCFGGMFCWSLWNAISGVCSNSLVVLSVFQCCLQHGSMVMSAKQGEGGEGEAHEHDGPVATMSVKQFVRVVEPREKDTVRQTFSRHSFGLPQLFYARVSSFSQRIISIYFFGGLLHFLFL